MSAPRNPRDVLRAVVNRCIAEGSPVIVEQRARKSPTHRTDSRGVVRVLDTGAYLAQQLRKGRDASRALVTCGACHRTWDDSIATAWTPAPAARCPFEDMHKA